MIFNNDHKILDFGGNDGSFMAYLIPERNNDIYIAVSLGKRPPYISYSPGQEL